MARKKKYIKMNETIKSLEDWNEAYKRLESEIASAGLEYSSAYDKQYWFSVRVLNQKISGGWNSFALGYENLYEKVKLALSRYGTAFQLKVVIDLDMWAKESEKE